MFFLKGSIKELSGHNCRQLAIVMTVFYSTLENTILCLCTEDLLDHSFKHNIKKVKTCIVPNLNTNYVCRDHKYLKYWTTIKATSAALPRVTAIIISSNIILVQL